MKTLDEIKQMMAAGDTAKAAEALKEVLAKEPENLQAKMLYGTCCQLLGDEATFKRIHDELAPEMEKFADDQHTADTIVPHETISLWKKYHALWLTLIAGGLILAGLTGAVWWFGKSVMSQCATAYRGPIMEERNRNQLYAGPPRTELKVYSSKRIFDSGGEL